MSDTNQLSNLVEEFRKFAAERDWEQFYILKNLSMAMANDAAEVMEKFSD